MDIKEMQSEVDEWINQEGAGYWEPLSMLARLSEEVGELARILNHYYGGKRKKPEEQLASLDSELGDLLFTIICIANSFEISLEQAYEMTIKKSKIRDTHRYK